MTDIIVEDIPQDEQPHKNITTVPAQTDSGEHLAIAGRYSITIPTKEEDEKLQTIWGWVKQQKGERPIQDIIWDVINLEGTIGSPNLGQTRLDKLYKYVKLRINEARIQEQLKETVL